MSSEWLFEFDEPESGVRVKVLEPPGSSPQGLCQRILNGTYGRPFIIETSDRRYLHFDLESIQSAMDLDDPQRLAVPYTRKIMSFLLFDDSPGRILLLGLGGGSIAKFCYWRLPGTAITTVEMNSDVIALREQFCIPKGNERFRIVQGNGLTYVADGGPEKDVIVADACDARGIAPELDTLDFYHGVYRRLRDGGVFVLNLCGERVRWRSHLHKLSAVFGRPYLWIPVPFDENVIVFAFRAHLLRLHWKTLESRAWDLAARFGLDFPAYVQRLAQPWIRGWQPPPTS